MIVELLKKTEGFNIIIFNKIMSKHNNELNDDCITNLLKYYDYLDNNIDFDSKFMLMIKSKYGITKEYLNNQDKQWDDLEIKLDKIDPEGMAEIDRLHLAEKKRIADLPKKILKYKLNGLVEDNNDRTF